MNANAVAKNYGRLTALERFSLIFAAGARGDKAEQDRLLSAGKRITLSMPDHAPYVHAFRELSSSTFIELVEDAADYFDFMTRSDELEICDALLNPNEGDEAERANDDSSRPPAAQRIFDIAAATGALLRMKAEAWKLFCERLTVPPFLLWEKLPGFDRLQSALKLAEEFAFTPEGFRRYLIRIRATGQPEVPESLFDVDRWADATATVFENRTRWWGGPN